MFGSFHTCQYHDSTSALPYRSTQCFVPLEDQLGPLLVVLRRVGPAGVDLVVLRLRRPLVLVRLGLDRQLLGHEPDLHVGLHAALEVGVEDAVDDRPVVDRLAVGVLGVGVGRAPLQGRGAVAGGEQVVRAEVDLLRAELAEFGEQLLAVLHVGVVRLVGAEEPPDRLEVAAGLVGPDGDRDRRGRRRPAPTGRSGPAPRPPARSPSGTRAAAWCLPRGTSCDSRLHSRPDPHLHPLAGVLHRLRLPAAHRLRRRTSAPRPRTPRRRPARSSAAGPCRPTSAASR